MSDTVIVDNDFIDKLAQVDQLDLLKLEGKKTVITDKVYAELERGVEKNSLSAVKAMDWLDANRSQPWLELEVPTKPLSPELAKTLGGGEGSIVSYINEQKALDLTPEQQEIFDRVVGIVTQNDELRHQFKTAMNELHKQPNWDDANYMSDSDDPPAANARVVLKLVKIEINKLEPELKEFDSWLYDDICDVICNNYFDA